VMAKGEDIVPIAGTKHPDRLEENVGATELDLSSEQIATLDETVSPESVRGSRYAEREMELLNH
jgi:aryl-alcohol dehydrogenase-like predicted oxidoreductase